MAKARRVNYKYRKSKLTLGAPNFFESLYITVRVIFVIFSLAVGPLSAAQIFFCIGIFILYGYIKITRKKIRLRHPQNLGSVLNK